jgi:hypothetical protein
LGDLAADIQKVASKHGDELFKIVRRLQRFDSVRQVAKLPFELCQIDWRFVLGSGTRGRPTRRVGLASFWTEASEVPRTAGFHRAQSQFRKERGKPPSLSPF